MERPQPAAVRGKVAVEKKAENAVVKHGRAQIRMATKYALDFVNIAEHKKRQKVHELTAKIDEREVEKRNYPKIKAKDVIIIAQLESEIMKTLGKTRGKLFLIMFERHRKKLLSQFI